jgi:hypothetical protein
MGCYGSSEQKHPTAALMGGANRFIGLNWEEDSSPLLLNNLVLGREKIRNSPCDNIQDSFAVGKQ